MVSSNRWVRSVGQLRGCVAALLLPLAMLSCSAQAPEHESSGSSTPVEGGTQAKPSAARLKPGAVSAPRVVHASIRSAANTYEVEVQSPKGFSPRAFDPVLRIGDKEFSNYRESAQVGEYGAVFRVERKDFEALSDDSAVSVSYGRGIARPLALGRLDKRALAVR